jgi:hypothetical protein
MYTTLKGTPVTATKGFNESLSEQWLTSEALVETLGRYSDTSTDIGKRATAAAQDVKTFSQMMDTMKESAGSGWAESSELIFGNFDEAKELWTGVNNVLGGMITASADARNKVLTDWNKAGGRAVLIEGISNAFHALMDVLKPIKDAFREIFPAKTGQDLFELTEKFRDFTEKLKISDETAARLKSTFKGIFAFFSIIGSIVSGVIGVIWDLVGALTGASGGFLAITGGIGEWLSSIATALTKGEGLTGFFDGLSNILTKPIELFKSLGTYLKDFFGGFDSGTASGVVDIIKSIGEALGEVFSGTSISNMFSAINTGLFGALVLAIRKFLSGFGKDVFGKSGIRGMFESIGGVFTTLTDSLKAMQNNIKADTLMKIAIAVGILTISIVALALIDVAKLVKAMAAITVSFGLLLGAMAILEKIGKSAGFMKMPSLTLSMMLMATAILILSNAIKNLAELSWDELGRGLAGLGGAILILVASIKPLSKDTSGIIKAAFGLIVFSIAIKILASALGDFGEMSLSTIGSGLIGVAAALVVIITAVKAVPNSILRSAISIAILSVALKLLADVVATFGAMSVETIGKGLLGIAGALIVIGAAMWAMPKNMILMAAGLVLVGIALKSIADAVVTLGGMTWEALAIGLIALGGALAILAAGLYLMTGSLAGSAALLVAAAALAVIIPLLMALSTLAWPQLLMGLGALAGLFVVLGVAGLLLTPVVPVILLLGISLLALGAGLALAGVGVLAFVTALAILVGLGAAAAAAIGAILSTLISKIPEAMTAFAEGIISFAQTISQGVPAFVSALTALLTALMQAIINAAPKIAEAFMKILEKFLEIVVTAAPKIAKAAFDLLMSFLKAISDNIYRIVTVVTDIITEFMNALGDNADDLADAGADMIIDFINALSDAIDENAEELGRAGGRLAVSIVKGMVKGIMGGVSEIGTAAKNAAKAALDAAKNFLGISSPSKEFFEIGKFVDLGMVKGILKYTPLVEDSVVEMGDTALDTMKTTMAQVSDLMLSDLDASPVITPVLDLSSLQTEAGRMGAIFAAQSVTAGVSFGQATTIAQDRSSSQTTDVATIAAPAEPVIKFEQNNYSPKALSEVEIYRLTKNQLSLAKEALK